MGEVDGKHKDITFNGPLEAGVRAVAVLAAAYPKTFDLQRLTAFDYLLVRTSELDGPPSLHPQTPIRDPNAEVRRKVVQLGLTLMMTRDLINQTAAPNGIEYVAGESASLFVESLREPYHVLLRERANWLVIHFAKYTDNEFRRVIHSFFDNWAMEFQHIENSLGGDTQ